MSGPLPHPGPGRLQLVGEGEASKEWFRGVACGRLFLSVSAFPAGSETKPP